MRRINVLFTILVACFINPCCELDLISDCEYSTGYLRANSEYQNDLKLYTFDGYLTVNWSNFAYDSIHSMSDSCELINVSYNIQVFKNDSLIEEEEEYTPLSYQLKNQIDDENNYYFRIRYKTEKDSLSDWSLMYILRNVNWYLHPIYPSYSSDIAILKPTFEWEIVASPGFAYIDQSSFSYHFRLFKGCDGNNNYVGIIEEEIVTGVNYYTIDTELKKGEHYVWRVDFVGKLPELGRFQYICYCPFDVN